MSEKKVFPESNIPIRKSTKLLPDVFKTPANEKFFAGALDPLVQPGVLQKTTGYIGRRYGKTFKESDIYLDTDQTLRSRYQLEPGVTIEKDQDVTNFYDYIDQKNMLRFFGNYVNRDDKVSSQEHYSWTPPIDWDKFVNYREYFWAPQGPDPVAVSGQSQGIISTYKVRTGLNSWVFSPDGATNNPTLTLYRGQTYRFEVNSPEEGFIIRTNYDTGSLVYQPERAYFAGSQVVYDEKLWKAKVDIPADGSTIDINSEDWELVDSNARLDSLNFDIGVTNNGATVGVVEFTVPQTAPDILFYQSDVDANRLGQFLIADIQSNTFIDVEKEIVGKKNYLSSNGVELSNGLILEFRGGVYPEKYASSSWLVEGVGDKISLTNFAELVPANVTSSTPEIVFDNEGFDTQPFDDATQYPGSKDYITISRTSKDNNPWSRYNRWFHRSVLEYSAKQRNSSFDAPEELRAKRPIIEFKPNIKLFNHGSVAKGTVDYVDDYTTDVFSNIEGSTGYSVDGEFLFEGARVLVVSDTDNLANNKIYTVNFIDHNGKKQINLKESDDSESLDGEGVLVRRGTKNQGKMFHYTGTSWVESQSKTSTNQYPLFDLFDKDGNSFGDVEYYPVSSFKGTPLLSFAEGTGYTDKELGIKLKYLNINNVGDILFNWNLDKDTFTYTEGAATITKTEDTGFYLQDSEYKNGWSKTDQTYLQPIVDTTTVKSETNTVSFEDTILWTEATDNLEYILYVNGSKYTKQQTNNNGIITFEEKLNAGDTVTIKLIDDIEPAFGYYEFPIGLEKNPLNEKVQEFTLGQAADHVSTGLEFSTVFSGTVPGNSNLRDLDDFQVHTKRFMKHSGVAAAALALMNDRSFNIIKSIQYAKNSYRVFKENFIKKATEIDFEENIPTFVDKIIAELSRTKSIESPFADSDMIGSGAFNKITYTVKDVGIKTFALGEAFDINALNRKAVYVYINNVQLLLSTDYTIDTTFGFVRITKDLVEGDTIEIREYISTAFSHIPPTPTALGIYKKYTPKKFIDDTYIEAKDVIQGHDGSITIAYNDFRDDVLLELEYRIYNNIKVNYDEKVFDIDSIIGGYYGNSEFKLETVDNIVGQEFLKWISNTGLNYTTNSYFVENEEFTYTYNTMADPTGSQDLPGWWRGVYRYFYDTDRPHTHPWETLGFTEEPTWWEEEYGAAPYTSGNLLLWEDIRDGIIRQGPRAGTYKRYARTSIMKHLPVNADGELVDPLRSGLATNFSLINNRGGFKFGDWSPVENAWRTSSEYPFAVTLALCLLKPFDYIINNFDRNKTTTNLLDQVVDKETYSFLQLNNITIPVAGTTQTSGLANYISSYVKSRGMNVTEVQEKLHNLQVRLSSRLSGFVDIDQQRYLLDSKNPNSASSTTLIPQENYNVIFDTSSPIETLTYSGLIFEKTSNGWSVNGYDDVRPYFEYYTVVPNQKDPVINVGGVSASFTQWESGKTYPNGAIVEYRNYYYRSKESHSSQEFDAQYFTALPQIPIIGATTAQRRSTFNTSKVQRLPYGHTFTQIQDVADFIFGHQHYLISQGFEFSNYDGNIQKVQDWSTALEEFMFWTQHNWEVGSLLTVSPGAEQIVINKAIGVADSLFDGFYDYNILTNDGTQIDTKFIDVSRDFQKVTIKTVNTEDGLYYLKVNYVLKENVAIFNDRTVFNDIIFDKSSGYRQERIKSFGYRTVDWDGDYTSPGFLFDNVSIDAWQPFRNYRLGDIIQYRSTYYTSRYNHTSEQEFNQNNWTVLDSEPSKKLVPNFDYRISSMEDYFAVDNDGLDQTSRDLARHTVGFQSREYLESLAVDPVTQFQLYQGFIKEKGTLNPLQKLFNKTTVNGSGVTLNEEWAFKVGSMGGVDQTQNIELSLQTDNFKINPQPVIVTPETGQFLDKFYRVNKDNFDYALVPYTDNVNPVTYDSKPFKTAGYVSLGQTEYTIKTIEDLATIDVSNVQDNQNVWITFHNADWTVLRINFAYELPVVVVTIAATTVTIDFEKRHKFSVGDYVGIKDLVDISGIHKITAITPFTITYEIEDKKPNDSYNPSTAIYPIHFTETRVNEFDNLTPEQVALLKTGSKVFVDDNGSGRWEVVQKQKAYSSKEIVNYGLSDPSGVGKKVVYNQTLQQYFVSAGNDSRVIVFVETPQGLDTKFILQPPSEYEDAVRGTYGDSIALSPDNKWLAIGAPLANGIDSNFRGNFGPFETYQAGHIVLYSGKLWKAKQEILGDGSTLDLQSDDWEIVKNIEADSSGVYDGETQMGVVFMYEWLQNQWNFRYTYVSPRIAAYEQFGSQISLAKKDDTYHLVISAPGSLNQKGRVYLFTKTDKGFELDQNEAYAGEYNLGEVTFDGEISGTTLTVAELGDSTPLAQKLEPGAYIEAEGIEIDTVITGQLTGEPGGAGTYTVNISQTTDNIRMRANYFYPAGTIVYWAGQLWKALSDNYSDGSSLTIESDDWILLDDVAQEGTLPQSVALEDDGSSIFTGLISDNQVAEMVMNGTKFGTSMALSQNGDVLVVGAPDADGQFFPNYKGLWQPDFEYIQDDVVRYQGSYHKLTNIGPGQVPQDSTIRSYNEEPDNGYPWVDVGDSTPESTGKIYIYRKINSVYQLQQTVTTQSLDQISDLPAGEVIAAGDKFGWAVDIDYAGNTIVVSSPQASINLQNQGSAYVLKYETDSSVTEFRVKQKLESYGIFANEYFGQSISISSNGGTIAVGANNSRYAQPIRFDGSGTSFDSGRTTFRSYEGFSGAVYVYEIKEGIFYLAEKLDDDLSLNESFGESVFVEKDIVIVGSPDYVEPILDNTDLSYAGNVVGNARLFRKAADTKSLNTLTTQPKTVDIEQVKRVALYERNDDVKIQDLEFVDPAKLKLLNSAERELTWKTPYDPAVYSVGTDTVVVDNDIAWNNGKHVGKLWWNIGNAKWIDYEQGDTAYRAANWGRLAEGSTIDVYEWVQSKLLPSEWAVLADTTEGLNLGISGQPLYPEDNVYAVKQLFNVDTGEATETLYSYWVRNKLIAPDKVDGRKISASAVATQIASPGTVGNSIVALIDSNKFLFYNFTNVVNSDFAILNVEYYKDKQAKNAQHNEYMLLSEGVEDSVPNESLETKWIDSLIGYDKQGNRIPDTKLPEKQKYGLSYRPRQSMFVQKRNALQIIFEYVNDLLKKEAFADVIDFTKLNSKDELPSELLKLYDSKVDFYSDLENVGTTRVKVASLRANLVDGSVNSITIVDPGYGYKVAPPIEFEGDGKNAEAVAVLDNQGRIESVTITNEGSKYSTVIPKVRNFSVLVESDSTANNFWSIYAWDDVRKTFFRTKSQSFDTSIYYDKVTWWKPGYSDSSRIVQEIPSVYEEPSLNTTIGDLIRIKDYGAGGWAVFEKVTDVTSSILLYNYELVGRQNGTLQFSDRLWNTKTSGIGFDIVDAFDAGLYDNEVAIELRNILQTLKEDIFVGPYAGEWNTIFFKSIRYVFEEQTYVDWAFKTSFITATHNIGGFKTTTNYKSDNLTSYLDYINEMKPYRTTVREFVSKYDQLETAPVSTVDFDLPPIYDKSLGQITTVTESNDFINQFPYNQWKLNKGYSITKIVVSNAGQDYTTAPRVEITGGGGTGATAVAYVASGKVTAVEVTNKGSGYTSKPTVSLVGGNGSSNNNAQAVPILGDGVARNINLTVKFDRLTKDGSFTTFDYEQTFTATGNSAVFELSYPAIIDKSKIEIIKDGEIVLDSEYDIQLFTQLVNGYSVLKAKVLFNENPVAGSTIKVTYEKNDQVLDSVDRINKYYSPASGMIGKEVNQLMTGIDFGGVLVQGTTFDVTGGWDALPWFTDSWDSVEAAADYYVVVDGSTIEITLPYAPADGQEINIYLKRQGLAVTRSIDDLQYSDEVAEPKTIRIDDPNWTPSWDSSVATNPNAQMPTFYGDGSTKVIQVGEYVSLNEGDTLIFRPSNSDGSVSINDNNLLDTNLSGGTLESMNGAYTTATGTTAEAITIDGSGFTTPEHVPATEENIPGQVLDSYSIKVFQRTDNGAASMHHRTILADGTTAAYAIGQRVLEKSSVIVYIDQIEQTLGTDYTIDNVTETVTFITTPTTGQTIEIFSTGLGGLKILDYKEFTADGETGLFLTQANYVDTSTIYVTLNGVQYDTGFIESTDVVDVPNKTLVQFGTVPARNDKIKIVVLGASTDVDSSLSSVVRVNQQEITYEGSTRSFDLDDFVQLTRESAISSTIVELGGVKLRGVDTIFKVYDGGTKIFDIGVDPKEAPGAVLPQNIEVYINGERQTYISDWVYSATTKKLEYTSDLKVGDEIKITNDLRAEYSIENNNLVIDSGVVLEEGDKIEVTWFGEYPSMSIVNETYVGGKLKYRLPFKPISISYVWVYVNGVRQRVDRDYYVDIERQSVYLENATDSNDIITVFAFGDQAYKLPSAYEINKDMLNITRYSRFITDDTVTLAKDLNYYDKTITVSDASSLTAPQISKNVPGVVTINNERIEYMVIDGNTLKQLRRGAYGTAIATTHTKGSLVADVGNNNHISYSDTQLKEDFISDGSSNLIGPLEFTPVKANDTNFTRTTIPEDYGRCDTIEVFAGGKRLRKTSLTVFDPALGSHSPAADKTLEAEFSVDGSSNYIRLTEPVSAGTRITIVRKIGATWYDRGETTATTGETLLDNNGSIPQFIADKSTRLPE